MLIDELLDEMSAIKPDIETIVSYVNHAGIEDEHKKLTHKTIQEDFWKNTEQAKILKRLEHLRSLKAQYENIMQLYNELPELIHLFADDEAELKRLQKEVYSLKKQVHTFKIHLLLNQELDKKNCFFSINAGAGGTESQDWASMLLRMYLRFCEREKLKAQIVDYQPGDGAGIKSATIFVKGKNAFGYLKGESGIHRLVRISPFDANKRRHTSFAAASATPEAEEIHITIESQDLRIDTYRASGAGGQHVNTTDSAVRITHIPSGIVVQCQNERSQTQNKETAMKMLKSRLYQRQQEEEEKKQKATEKKRIEWGSQIRSYVLHPYQMVKDHRTGHESSQPHSVLDGQIMPFIEQNLIYAHQSNN